MPNQYSPRIGHARYGQCAAMRVRARRASPRTALGIGRALELGPAANGSSRMKVARLKPKRQLRLSATELKDKLQAANEAKAKAQYTWSVALQNMALEKVPAVRNEALGSSQGVTA